MTNPSNPELVGPEDPSQKTLATLEFRLGPLPPPDDLKQYEQLSPGITDRMMTLIENEMAAQTKAQNDNAEPSNLENTRLRHYQRPLFSRCRLLCLARPSCPCGSCWNRRADPQYHSLYCCSHLRRFMTATRSNWLDEGSLI